MKVFIKRCRSCLVGNRFISNNIAGARAGIQLLNIARGWHLGCLKSICLGMGIGSRFELVVDKRSTGESREHCNKSSERTEQASYTKGQHRSNRRSVEGQPQ